MRIHQIFESPIILITSFCITAALSHSSAIAGNEESAGVSNVLITQGLQQNYGNAKISFTLQNAKPGSAVSGVQIAGGEPNNFVYIDSTPCSTEPKRIVAFVKPYTSGKVGDAVCGGKHYSQVQVIQE